MDNHVFINACRAGGRQIESVLRAMDRDMAPLLYSYCRRTIRDTAVAEEVVQETLIKVWTKCTTFRGDGALLVWVKGILRRTAIDVVRMQRPETAMDNDDGEPRPEVQRSIATLSSGARLDPKDVLHDREVRLCYQRCFASLERASPLQAMVMRWVIEDGLDNAQVADLLDRTPGATRQFLFTARREVRRHFAEWYEMVASRTDRTGRTNRRERPNGLEGA